MMHRDLVPHSNQGWLQEQVRRQYFADIAGVVEWTSDIDVLLLLLLGWDRTECTCRGFGVFVDLQSQQRIHDKQHHQCTQLTPLQHRHTCVCTQLT